MAPPMGSLTPRTVMAPAAAFTMACVLFMYTRSSIKTARRNAVRCLPACLPACLNMSATCVAVSRRWGLGSRAEEEEGIDALRPEQSPHRYSDDDGWIEPNGEAGERKRGRERG
ncbi:hypothetical protein F4780DRAFT_452382 [Xylariomycetidae sp. FL0641]|nr:hypothetical protein F4780DRAFT_452382 [Xylariomycetidae sp. FL0641]